MWKFLFLSYFQRNLIAIKAVLLIIEVVRHKLVDEVLLIWMSCLTFCTLSRTFCTLSRTFPAYKTYIMLSESQNYSIQVKFTFLIITARHGEAYISRVWFLNLDASWSPSLQLIVFLPFQIPSWYLKSARERSPSSFTDY